MKNILILGANGFLGSNMVSYYRKKEFCNVTLADLAKPKIYLNNKFEFINLNLLDKERLKEVLVDKDIIYNFVGHKGVLDSFINYNDDLEINCRGMLNILDIIKEFEKKPLIVFPSSRLVYGGSQNKTILDETDCENPDTVYGTNKLAAENYLKSYNNLYDIPYLIFRISIPYGYHFDKINKNNGIVNFFIKRALNGKNIKIFGDGMQKRDIINVRDLIKIIGNTIHKCKIKNQVFNLGGNEVFSIVEIAETISDYYNVNVINEKWDDNNKRVETGNLILDNSKIIKRIKYQPMMNLNKFLKRLKEHN